MMKIGHSAVCQKYGSLVARLALSALFVISGAMMLMDISGTAGWFASIGIPAAAVAVWVVVLVKILGGLSVATGMYARKGAAALIVFTIVATFYGHMNPFDMVAVLKNVAIIGGLILVMTRGAGNMSMGKDCDCSHGSCDCGNKKEASAM